VRELFPQLTKVEGVTLHSEWWHEGGTYYPVDSTEEIQSTGTALQWFEHTNPSSAREMSYVTPKHPAFAKEMVINEASDSDQMAFFFQLFYAVLHDVPAKMHETLSLHVDRENTWLTNVLDDILGQACEHPPYRIEALHIMGIPPGRLKRYADVTFSFAPPTLPLTLGVRNDFWSDYFIVKDEESKCLLMREETRAQSQKL
jgi:hypothetical protein